APATPKINRVGHVALALFTLLPERMFQRAPFYLQPDASAERIEMPVLCIRRLQTELSLHAMKALVQHQAHPRLFILRQGPHYHGPLDARPFCGGVRDAQLFGRGSRKDAVE